LGLRHWIELSRVHTAGLTTALFVGGYLLAGGTILSMDFLLWFICGIVYHLAGFIHNNIMDVPFDAEDPQKKHFPLVTGAISLRKADEVDRYLMILFCFFAAYLTRLQPIPTFFLILAITSGLLYDNFAKVTPIAILGVATGWGILPLISYFSTTSQFSPVILFLVAYSWVQVFIQISVLGSLKDLEAPRENNLLRKLGCHVEGARLTFSSKARDYAVLLKVFHFFLLFLVLMVSQSSQLAFVLSVIFYTASWMMYLSTMEPEWQRDKVLGRIVLNEAFCFLAVMPAIQGVIGWEAVAVLLIYPPIWVFTWMRLQWRGWRLGPKV